MNEVTAINSSAFKIVTIDATSNMTVRSDFGVHVHVHVESVDADGPMSCVENGSTEDASGLLHDIAAVTFMIV